MVAALSNMPAGSGQLTTALQECDQSCDRSPGATARTGSGAGTAGCGTRANTATPSATRSSPPTRTYPYCQFWDTNSDWDSAGICGLTSFHPGGANVCFADGSIRFLKSSVAWNTLWSLGSRDQGEVVDANSY